MTKPSTIDRNAWMVKVQGLIDKANGTDNQAEKDAFMAKADQLMVRHAIEQFELEQAMPADQREKPVVATVVAPTARNWRVTGLLDTVFHDLARHCGVMIGRDHEFGAGTRTWKVVGFPADVDYLGMLYLSVQITIVSKMEPKVDPNLTEVENYANLREAGVAVERILPMLGHEYFVYGEYEEYYDQASGSYRSRQKQNRTVLGRFRRQYAKLCAERGTEPVKGLTGEAYLLCFVDAFQTQLRDRLRELKGARDEVTTGHELVVADRSAETKNLLWDTWPEMKPHPKDCGCERCHWCGEEDCQFEKCRRYFANKDKPIPKSHFRQLAYNPAGAAAGKSAANTVNLSKGSVSGGTKGELG